MQVEHFVFVIAIYGGDLVSGDLVSGDLVSEAHWGCFLLWFISLPAIVLAWSRELWEV